MTDHPGLSEQRARDGMQHVAYFDEGEFHWMSGIKARDCELYAPLTSSAAFAQPPASGVDRSRDGHTLDETGYNCSCHARFSTRWEAAEHAGISHGGPLAALTNSGAPVPGDGLNEWTAEEVRQSVRQSLDAGWTHNVFARTHGISSAKLSEFLSGKRGAEPFIVEPLGFRWVLVSANDYPRREDLPDADEGIVYDREGPR